MTPNSLQEYTQHYIRDKSGKARVLEDLMVRRITYLFRKLLELTSKKHSRADILAPIQVFVFGEGNFMLPYRELVR